MCIILFVDALKVDAQIPLSDTLTFSVSRSNILFFK